MIKTFVLHQMTVSFTRTPSIGSAVCNFRRFCDSWTPDCPWPCSCSYLARTFGILDVPESYVPVLPDGSHVHARFDRCHNGHAIILRSNLRDAYHPSSSTVVGSLTRALRAFLSDVQRFSNSRLDLRGQIGCLGSRSKRSNGRRNGGSGGSRCRGRNGETERLEEYR